MIKRQEKITSFQKEIWDYYRAHGRVFPWRRTKDPYKIMVSEMMLQQTQTSRVVEKYKQFLKLFPTVAALAQASRVEVLRVWQGLGYNRRALYLQQAATAITSKYRGKVPDDHDALISLSGIGPNTAGAIRAFAFNQSSVFIETNIRRVFIHFFFPRSKQVNDALIRRLVEQSVDQANPREWYWALMDYGVHLAAITENANRRSAHYSKQSPFENSLRQLRGKLIRLLLDRGNMSRAQIKKQLPDEDDQRITGALDGLTKDGLISRHGQKFSLNESK